MPGINYHDGMSRYEIRNARLIAAFENLQREESALGRWALGGELQERFQLVGRFLDESGRATVSDLLPDQVARSLDNSGI